MIKIRIGKQKFGYDISPYEHLLFLTVGMAMGQIQNFENLVATILASLDGGEITLETIDDVFAKFDLTLGVLIKKMKQKVGGQELHDRLESIRTGRNFIAHHSLRQYPNMDGAQTLQLVKKIAAIVAEIDEVQELLIAELSAQDVTHISEIYIDPDSGEIKDV